MTIMKAIEGDHTHRPISYAELAILDVMFRRKVVTQHIRFESLTQREIALLDYIEQYYEGIDCPTININAI